MPKPLFADNGQRHCTRTRAMEGGKPLFAGDGYAGLSGMALNCIGGLLKQPGRCRQSCSHHNSYNAWCRGYEAPSIWLTRWRNRSAHEPDSHVLRPAEGESA